MGKKTKTTALIAAERKRYLHLCLLPLAVLLAFGSSFGQKNYNFYNGRVIESVTKQGMPGVNLSVEGSRIGTVSDKTGAFSFFIDSLPATLTVSYMGYETKSVLLDATSYSLTLYLARKATELKEVEIVANALEPFFRDEHYSVLDYETDSGMVYLLIYRNYLSKSELICKNIYGDTVATSVPFYFKPERLFKDCLGTLHVLSRDSGFQVFRQDTRLHLVHPVNLKKFDNVLKNCVASTPDILYFQKVTNHGLGVEYFGVNRATLVKSPVAQVKDEKRMKMLRRNATDAQLLGSKMHPDSREDFVTWNYVHKILYRPVKTALYLIGDYTCIFNTPAQQIEFYDGKGNFSYKLALKTDLVKEGRWTGEVMVDDRSGKVYTTFLQNGTIHVFEININSGLLKKCISLAHSFPQKIKVYNNFIYYLYDVSGDPDNKMLYRQKF